MTYDYWRILDLLIAYALAFPLGIERERSEHTAGIRTFPLVAIATCAFLIAAGDLKKDHADVVSRVLQGVVAGMGFIGGGAILKTGDSVVGTATAAGLWGTAAIGACVAMHSYDLAIALSVLSFVTLHVLKRFTHEPELEQASAASAKTDHRPPGQLRGRPPKLPHLNTAAKPSSGRAGFWCLSPNCADHTNPQTEAPAANFGDGHRNCRISTPHPNHLQVERIFGVCPRIAPATTREQTPQASVLAVSGWVIYSSITLSRCAG